MPDWRHEDARPAPVAGVDEAGRGPTAGPVVAAAVILDRARAPVGLDDSKKLSKARRAALFEALWDVAEIGVGVAEPHEIDDANILRASLRAMARAVAALPRAPGWILVDGDRAPETRCPATPIVGGDGASVSIAAASIVAKVTRDRLMADAERRWPGYGFARHAGYPTAAHADALAALGACPIHRRSFAPVRAAARAARSR